MTTSRQFGDSEGDFGEWKDHPQPCNKWLQIGTTEPVISAHRLKDEGRVYMPCGAKVQIREWESHDGAYTDYQYRCAAGHTWWIDGSDS